MRRAAARPFDFAADLSWLTGLQLSDVTLEQHLSAQYGPEMVNGCQSRRR